MAQTRVMLWCIPRSRSTAFELSMASVPSFKVFHAEYAHAQLFGEDREKGTYANLETVPNSTLNDVKAKFEAAYPDKEAVIAKDFVLCATFKGNYDSLPNGYQHTFLIREPNESYISMYKFMTALKEKGLLDTDPTEETLYYCSFKQVNDLYNYLVVEKGQHPVIINSNDLAENPRALLQKYCKITGIPFYESMLNWQPGNTGHWPEAFAVPYFGFIYKNALESSCFLPPQPKADKDTVEIPIALQEAIERDTVIYQEMVKNKI